MHHSLKVRNCVLISVLEQLLERKSALFAITAGTVVVILTIPVISPHMLHGYHMVHIALHIGGLTFAMFLTILSIASYHRMKRRRLMISSLAFGCFTSSEVVLLTEATWPFLSIGALPLEELGHFLAFAGLGLLAMAVFRDD